MINLVIDHIYIDITTYKKVKLVYMDMTLASVCPVGKTGLDAYKVDARLLVCKEIVTKEDILKKDIRTLAMQLVNLMLLKNMTVEKISQMFGVSRLTIHRWLAAEIQPHPAIQAVLIKKLNKLKTML